MKRMVAGVTPNKRGSALIEFAFALAILTPAFVGGWQFFAAYWLVEEIQSATNQGARTASVLPYDSVNEIPSPAFRRAAQDAVLRSPVPGLKRENIAVAMRFEAGRPRQVEVKVTGFRIPVPGGAIQLDGKPTASYPYLGHWSASAPR